MRTKQTGRNELQDVLALAAERGVSYATAIGGRRVSPTAEALAALREFRGPMPEEPCDAREVIETLDRVGSPGTVATQGGRYFGFVIGGSLPAVTGASWLASAWDQNVGLRVMSPIAAE